MNLLFSLLLACGEKTTDTSNHESDTDDTSTIPNEPSNNPGDCTPLSEEECLGSESCMSIMASPLTYNETDTCWEEGAREFTECMTIEMGCGQAITYARPNPDASCMMFFNTCIPLEWDICDEIDFSECPQ